jgi:periplasmic divalent cation tolerance protein
MTDLRLLYVTTSSSAEAEKIAHALLAERLIACANLLPQMRSLYHWKGSIETADETVLILKTRAELVDQVITRTRELHSYACPCILSLPIETGNLDYLNWLKEETK